ncbi:YicC family protein [Candidatus Cloacimonadaceae bacterium]
MKSMTGFGNSKINRDGISLEIEIKSVNARYLDQRLYLPRELMFYEETIRRKISGCVSRGTVELRVSYTDHREPKLRLDKNKLLKYHDLAIYASQITGMINEVTLEFLLQEPGVIEIESNLSEDTALRDVMNDAIDQALEKLDRSLSQEASEIKKTLSASLALIETTLADIQNLIEPYKQTLYKRMLTRIEDLVGSYKLENLEQRLVQEIALYVDKYDIGEEISRLNTHIKTFYSTLEQDSDNGKTLNFIIQEMQREANTLGSKFSTSDSFRYVLTIKEEVEKCREIVQNVA